MATPFWRASVLFVALVTAGCWSSESTSLDDAATSQDIAGEVASDVLLEFPSDNAPPADLLSDSQDDFPPVQCGIPYPIFPWFDRKCSQDTDCAVVFHQVDCCGTLTAVGINAAGVEGFVAAEAVCDAQYPACGCAEGPTTAADGNWAFGAEAFGAWCHDGDCFSFVKVPGPPWAGIVCGSGQGTCRPGDEVCCVTSSPMGQACLKVATPCGDTNFAVACDGPEDCGPGGACCDPSGVSTGNFCATGGGCLALELTVCHVDADCGDGNACCPVTFMGWAHRTCQAGRTCH
jgi:hypothetical protein